MSTIIAHSNNMAAVPDDQHGLSNNPIPSFYDPACSLYNKHQLPLSDLDQLLIQEALIDLDGGSSPNMWDTLMSPLSLTSSPSITTSSNIPFPNTNEYLDLTGLYDSAHVSMDESSSIFSTHPSTPISAPLSPEEQEIQDIVTSFNDPITFYSPDSLDTPVLYSNSTATPTNNMATPSMATPILSQFLLSPVSTLDMSPPTSISPSSPFINPTSPLTISLPDSSLLPLSPSSPVTTTQQKPTTTVVSKKRTSRKKLPLSKKKERKKEQNKTAALRYRQKKKEECNTIEEKQDRLERMNQLLKQELNGLETEVNYLKQLWEEIKRHRNTC